MTKQHPLTLLTPVKKERLGKLYSILENINKDIQAGTEKEFKKVNTLHYARWFILCRHSFRDEPAVPITDRLVFSSNFDGNEDDHLTELATVLTNYLDQLYDCCEGYPAVHERSIESRKNFLKQCNVKTAAFFVGAPGRTKPQIEQEEVLHNHIWNFINKNKWDGKSAVEVHRAIREEINAKPEFDWSKQKAKVGKVQWHILLAYGLLIVLVLPLMIPFILYIFFFHELRDKKTTMTMSTVPDSNIARLEQDEDIFQQNQFTQVVVMKPGFARSLNFWIWMLRTKVLAGKMFVKGKLLNIPTIHFARWVRIDNNKHVLFFSNFDGSWQQYLGDFIDQSGWGLSGIFSNTVNFPKTHFMGLLGIVPGMPVTFPGSKFILTGGAYDEEHFLAWSRSTQLPTQVWYSAYPHLSIKNVNNNTIIRNELHRNLSEKKARVFLKRF